ncbi:Protein of unknown function [Bacillus wiedmannii]|nr:Protein of unknown function [Bacillus wiedmannii]
MEITSKPYLSS